LRIEEIVWLDSWMVLDSWNRGVLISFGNYNLNVQVEICTKITYNCDILGLISVLLDSRCR
jgi:hypothetical protein